jgi:hypothetical protein
MIGNLLYLLKIINVTPASQTKFEACNSAIWCNASDARKRNERGYAYDAGGQSASRSLPAQ